MTEHRYSKKGDFIILFWSIHDGAIAYYECADSAGASTVYSQWTQIINTVPTELKTLALLLK